MAKHSSYSNIYLDALLASLEEMREKTVKASSVLNSTVIWYFCVAEDNGDLILLAPSPNAEEKVLSGSRKRCLANMLRLSKSKGCDLSRELGEKHTGALRFAGRIFSLGGDFPAQIAEMLMLMVAIKVGMGKGRAKELLDSAPGSLASKHPDVEWI